MNRNQEIRKILESREIAKQQTEKQLEAIRKREEKRQVPLCLEDVWVRDTRFPWK